MSRNVSKCCGCSYEDSTISDCCTVEMNKDIPLCPKCEDHADCSGYLCNECGNWFEETEEEHEYNARMEENAMEEKEEARRKYGE
tara:strand:+ start:666 stop:920 length:255 start_codon:yes stop_codon:yes gene_type:complete